MNTSSYIIAILAGLLTTLSPCVLPVLPLVLASTLKAGRRGPIYFVTGLVFTFVFTTWAISSFGSVVGLDRANLRNLSGVMLLLAGILFLSERAQDFLTRLFSPIVDKMSKVASNLKSESKWEGGRQLILGALTGMIWTPCSGPSLGVAIGLAADRQNASEALLLLLVFGIGAAIPILAIAYGSKSLTKRLQFASQGAAVIIKKILSVLIIFVALAILTGFDKRVEATLVRISPDWLSDLTTRF